jgi:catechol 2,3-dioxygenase
MAVSEQTGSGVQIDRETTIGTGRLTVSDLSRARDFYERAVGLQARELEGGGLALGHGADRPVIELYGEPSATPLNRRATGLYHLAILLPSRRDLALALARLADARWPLDGASDHLVSEALYLSDPDGNGIEIYRDRPREQWPRARDRLEMATLPLDLRDLAGECSDATARQRPAPEGTRIGHVHLQVAELAASEAFYSGVLGFDVTVRHYPGALFVSAGGYHHHIGLNTWHSAGASPPPRGSVGLRSFEILLPNAGALEAVLERVSAAGIPAQKTDHGTLVRDPSGNGILLRER